MILKPCILKNEDNAQTQRISLERAPHDPKLRKLGLTFVPHLTQKIVLSYLSNKFFIPFNLQRFQLR